MQGDFSRSTFDPKKHYRSVRMQQGRVQLDADWNEQADIFNHSLETTLRDVIGSSGALAATAGFDIAFVDTSSSPAEQQGENVAPMPDFRLSAGRYYVDGILCENEQSVLFTAQPHHPAARLPATHKARHYLVYLDVWQRHVNAFDDPSIREVALGGSDTTTRAQTVWQAKLRPIHSQMPVDVDDLPYKEILALPEWRELIEASEHKPTMRARRQQLAYALDNRLYRVEIHHVRENAVTFKWSRENGSVVLEAEKIEPVGDQTGKVELLVTLGEMGRDKTRLQKDDWVEIVTEESVLDGHIGQLYQVVDRPDFTHQQVKLAGDPQHRGVSPEQIARKHPLLRRWDQKGTGAITLEAGAVALQKDTWIDLEAGIQIRFEGVHFQTGDYWLIPARALTGDVEWPCDADGPIARPPDGVEHHYCPLALVIFSGDQWQVAKDLRQLFDPLPVVSTRSRRKSETEIIVEKQEPPRFLSEVCTSGQELEEGDLVSLNSIEGMDVFKASEDNATLVIGVMTEQSVTDGRYRVVTYGRAKCKVMGPVAAGELLTVADRAGFARRVRLGDEVFRPGAIVGKALETFDPGESREMALVNIWVTLS